MQKVRYGCRSLTARIIVSASNHSSFRVLDAAKLACSVGIGFWALLPEPLSGLVSSRLPKCCDSSVLWLLPLQPAVPAFADHRVYQLAWVGVAQAAAPVAEMAAVVAAAAAATVAGMVCLAGTSSRQMRHRIA